MVVEKSTFVTLRSTRGRSQILDVRASDEGLIRDRFHGETDEPMVRCVIFAQRNFVICPGGVVRPGLFRHDELRDSLDGFCLELGYYFLGLGMEHE